MEQAYEETIRDLEIEMYSLSWWEIRKSNWLNNQIIFYKKLLKNIKK